MCNYIFTLYSKKDKDVLDIDDFSKLFNEHLDILEIFEKVFSTSRWKLSN